MNSEPPKAELPPLWRLNCVGQLLAELAQEIPEIELNGQRLCEVANALARTVGMALPHLWDAEPDDVEAVKVRRLPVTAALVGMLARLAEALDHQVEAERDSGVREVLRDVLRVAPRCVPASRVRTLLSQVGDRATCKVCGAPVWFVQHRSGKVGCWGGLGVAHQAECGVGGNTNEAQR